MSEGKRGVPVWVWFVVLVPLLFAGLGVGSALAIYGVRKYVMNAKQAEAQAALVAWGDGLVRCGERDGKLPPSTTPVPASLSTLAGKKYQSSAAEWAEPAHTCAGFSMTTPQYFQYAWELRGDADGMLLAAADLDGDGAAEIALELAVTCTNGKCVRGAVIDARPAAAGASGAASPGAASPATKTSGGEVLLVLLAAVAVAGVLGITVAAIWLTVLAFQESVGWGLIALFVPCGRYIFVFQFFDRCKKPALLYVFSVALILLLGLGAAVFQPLAGKSTPISIASATAVPGALPPPPKPVPIPEMKGAAVDLSSVMGRARKLANEWEPDAALLGVEATILNGRIQPSEGGSAKVTFGPSRFESARKHSGLFVVSYDKDGIRGAPAPGKPSVELPEPMCAPEAVLLRVAELGQVPITLRYGLDSVQRPSWLASPLSDPKALKIFEPQACQPRGTIVVRPRL